MAALDEGLDEIRARSQCALDHAVHERLLEQWHQLPTDAYASFDKEVDIDAAALEPMITYGTNPGMSIPITGTIPQRHGDAVFAKSLAYMGLEAGRPIISSAV